MKISYTGAYLATQPNKVKSAYALTAGGLQQITGAASTASSTAEKPVQLKDLAGALPAGGIATGSLKMYQLGNTTSQPELVQFLITNNVAPSHAGPLSQQVLDVVNSSGIKSVFIGLSGGAATYGVLEVIKPHWSWEKKALWSLGVAVVVSVIYLVLVQLGVMR